MLELFNSTVGMILALAFLLVVLFGPIAAVWLMFSMRRSLARIADSLDVLGTDTRPVTRIVEIDHENASVTTETRIANSIFGR